MPHIVLSIFILLSRHICRAVSVAVMPRARRNGWPNFFVFSARRAERVATSTTDDRRQGAVRSAMTAVPFCAGRDASAVSLRRRWLREQWSGGGAAADGTGRPRGAKATIRLTAWLLDATKCDAMRWPDGCSAAMRTPSIRWWLRRDTSVHCHRCRGGHETRSQARSSSGGSSGSGRQTTSEPTAATRRGPLMQPHHEQLTHSLPRFNTMDCTQRRTSSALQLLTHPVSLSLVSSPDALHGAPGHCFVDVVRHGERWRCSRASAARTAGAHHAIRFHLSSRGGGRLSAD